MSRTAKKPADFGERRRISVPERFARSWIETAQGCWEWQLARNESGYGRFWNGSRLTLAHRYAYELLVGAVPVGLTIDHLCRNKSCVNPSHLEPVTHRVNILRGDGLSARRARQTHCKRGHEFTERNTIRYRTHRQCRTCVNAMRRGELVTS